MIEISHKTDTRELDKIASKLEGLRGRRILVRNLEISEGEKSLKRALGKHVQSGSSIEDEIAKRI